jgi:hypothetical protein
VAIADIFRRVLFPVREKPASTDWNQLQERQAESLRAMANATFAKGSAFSSFSARHSVSPATGFHGGGFFVRPDAAHTPLGVELVAGFGFGSAGPVAATNIDTCQGADWDGALGMGVPLVLSAAQAFTIPTLPPAGSSRIDLIEVRPQYTATDPTTTAIFNETTLVYDPTTRNKSLSWDLRGLTGNVNAPNPSTACISYVRGVEAVGAITAATLPSATAGYTRLARINLDNSGGALTAVSQDMIADLRPLLFAGNLMHTGMRLAFPGKAAGLGTGLVGMRQKCPGVWITAGAQEGIAPAGGVSYQIEVYLFGGDLAPGLTPADEAGIPTIFPFASPRVPRMVLSPAYDLVNATVQSKLAGTTVGWTNYGGTASVAIGQPYLSFTFELIHPSGSALNNTEDVWLSLMMGRT